MADTLPELPVADDDFFNLFVLTDDAETYTKEPIIQGFADSPDPQDALLAAPGSPCCLRY